MEVQTEIIESQNENEKKVDNSNNKSNDYEIKNDYIEQNEEEKQNIYTEQNIDENQQQLLLQQDRQQQEHRRKSGRRKEKTLAEIENDVKKKWEEIKNCPKEDVDIAEKFYNDNSVILYVPTSIECHGIDDIKSVHSYKNHYGISTKDLSSEVIINTTVCGNTIIEEKILTILHSRPIQWLLPGVQATGRRLVLPVVTIVTFDNDLYIKSKRLYWDQACVLKQVGLIPTISRCPFNGEDTDLPVKGVQQSDPLLTKEQLEDMNSMDILNRHVLKKQSIERFKDLRSDYVNKNISDSVKKLIEEKGLGVDESVQSDGRRRSYNTIDFRNKSDTLGGFISGDIKEEYTMNEKMSKKIFKTNKNDSRNINEILSESNTDNVSNQGSNGASSMSSKTRRMFKEHLYQNDNVFSNNCDTSNTSAYSGKRIFANKNKDEVKISMEKSDSEEELIDSYSTIYDLDINSEKKWDSNSLSRQTYSRDETLTESNYSNQEDLINEKMKNLCLKNNFVEDESIRYPSNIRDNYKDCEKKNRKHRSPIIQPHFKSNITFDNYGSIDFDRPKPKFRHKKIMPKFYSSFKIAYDKEELEKDYVRSKKPVSPTYISHVFDKDDTVRKVRPIHKNSIFYENFKFDDIPSKNEIRPPLVVKDKYISNIFKPETPEVYRHHNKYSPDIRNHITYSNIHFSESNDGLEEEFVPRKSAIMEDHMNRIFAEPSIDNLDHPVINIIPKNSINYTTFNFDDPPEEQPAPSNVPKDKFVSHIFKTESKESVVPIKQANENDLTKRSGIYALIHNGSFEVKPERGIKTQYNRVDNMKGIFGASSKDKINFNDIKTINNIHNSMHQRQAQRV